MKYVNAYLWYKENELVGFSGTNDENLEMLFLDPQYFNKGYGTEILQYLVNEENIRYVDVNKDNVPAMQFYLKMALKNIVNLHKMVRVGTILFVILNLSK